MAKYSTKDFESTPTKSKYSAEDFGSKATKSKYSANDFVKGATPQKVVSPPPSLNLQKLQGNMQIKKQEQLDKREAILSPLDKMKSQTKPIVPQLKFQPTKLEQLNNKILSTGLDVIGKPANVLRNTLKAVEFGKNTRDITKPFTKPKNIIQIGKDVGKGVIEGITGKQKTSSWEALGASKELSEKIQNEKSITSKILNFAVDTATDPLTYIGPESIIKIASKFAKVSKGAATIADIAQATGKTEKELHALAVSDRAVQIEKSNQLLKDAKPVIKSETSLPAGIGKITPVQPQTMVGEIGKQTPINSEVIPPKYTAQTMDNTANATVTPKVENVASPVDGQSKFAQTVANSDKTIPQVAEDLKNLNLGYDVQTNADSLLKANKRIADDSEAAVRFVLDNKAPSAEHTTTAIQLINKFQNEGNFERAVDIASDISSKLTKNGQAIQAASIYDRLSPEGILLYAQRRVNKLNDERWFKGITKEQKINPDLAKQLKELSENMKNLTGDAKIEASQELQQALQALGKSTIFRKLESAQTISQLLNPKTLVRNTIGNELFYRLERLNKYIATPIDIARSNLTGGARTITFKTGGQGGYWEGFFKGAKAGWKGTNPAGLTTQFDLTAPAFSGKWNPLTYLEKTLGATLKGFDYAAYNRAVNQTIGEMAELKAMNQGLKGTSKSIAVQDFIKNTDKNILDIADRYGKYVTFQDDNVLSKGLSALKRDVLNRGKEFGLGSLVIKYPKTPGALIMRGLDYSPAGFLKSAYEVAKPLFKGGKIDVREATMALSRGITGTLGFTGLGYYLFENGVITGRTNKDKDVRDLQKQTGAGSYKVNLSALKRWATSGFDTSTLQIQPGDTLYSYDWMQPIAMAVSFGANINQNIKENKGVTNNLGATVASSLEGALGTITEQPVLQGIARQFQGYDLGQNAIQTTKGILSSFTPTLANQVRQFGDNTGRSTYDPSPVKESLNMAQVKIPGISGNLPTAYDTLEKQKENYQNGSNNFFNVFLNPGFVSKNNPTPVQKEILRIYEATGDKTQFPQVADKKFDWKEFDFILTSKEYSEFQKTLGEETSKAYERFMKMPEYQTLSDEDRVSKLGDLIGEAKKVAKFQLIKSKGLASSPQIMNVAAQMTQNKVTKKLTFDQQNEYADKIDKYEKANALKTYLTEARQKQLAKDKASMEMKREVFKR